jgi:hypothetical protein
MNLPKISAPTYELIVPSTKTTITYRPFLVKEETVLLLTKESKDANENEISTVIKQIVNNCVISELLIDDLSTFDLEYIFINLRSKSVGNIINLTYEHECPNNEKIKTIPFNLDLDEVTIEGLKENSNIIKINESISVIMKYPDYKLITELANTDAKEMLSDMKIIVNSMQYIMENDTKFLVSDFPHEEVVEFLESLTSTQFIELHNFFDTLPKTTFKSNIKCEHCDFTHNIHLTGITDFFV